MKLLLSVFTSFGALSKRLHGVALEAFWIDCFVSYHHNHIVCVKYGLSTVFHCLFLWVKWAQYIFFILVSSLENCRMRCLFVQCIIS